MINLPSGNACETVVENACETVVEKSITAAAEEIKSQLGTEIRLLTVLPPPPPYRLILERQMLKQCLKHVGQASSMRELKEAIKLNMILGKPNMSAHEPWFSACNGA